MKGVGRKQRENFIDRERRGVFYPSMNKVTSKVVVHLKILII